MKEFQTLRINEYFTSDVIKIINKSTISIIEYKYKFERKLLDILDKLEYLEYSNRIQELPAFLKMIRRENSINNLLNFNNKKVTIFVRINSLPTEEKNILREIILESDFKVIFLKHNIFISEMQLHYR